MYRIEKPKKLSKTAIERFTRLKGHTGALMEALGVKSRATAWQMLKKNDIRLTLPHVVILIQEATGLTDKEMWEA